MIIVGSLDILRIGALSFMDIHQKIITKAQTTIIKTFRVDIEATIKTSGSIKVKV